MGANPVSQRGRPPMNAASGGNRRGKRPQAGGRVFNLEGEEAENLTTTVSGTLLFNHHYVHILFDSGATYSFVNVVFAKKLTSKPNEMDVQLCVTTPLDVPITLMLFSKTALLNWKGESSLQIKYS